jgi:hypothetical protein
MYIYRAKHDNMPESPVRTLYGRKGNVLFVPLDVCILQVAAGGGDEFRPAPEPARLIAAPIQEEGAGRIGLIAHYEWPPLLADHSVNPVVTVQLAPSASVRGIEDLRVLAPQVHPGDAVTIDLGSGTTISGTIHTEIGWCSYPDLLHHVGAYRVELVAHVDVRLHGSAVRLTGNGGLLGMLIATQNEPGGTCRALVYPT